MVKSYAYRKIFSDNACTNDLTDEVTKLLALKKADGKSLVITRTLINLQMKLWNLLKADETPNCVALYSLYLPSITIPVTYTN